MPKKKDPDYIYDQDEWEYTYTYDDRGLLIEDVDLPTGEVRRYSTLIEGPKRFLVNVVTKRDEEGEIEETELKWFSTEAAAKAAARR